jgi:magnesium-protoporphyrin O-methyltransferase
MSERPGSCCYDHAFDARHANRKLADDRRKGPGRATRALASALAGGRADGLTVLDIGGGVGGLHHLLLVAGAKRATDVDASRPYLEAARREAERRGVADRVTFVAGDFIEVADRVEPADLVGLDRVVCCHPDVERLVGAAARHARRRLGIVVPRDGRLAEAIVWIQNRAEWITRSPLRVYAHRHARIVAAARAEGLEPVGEQPLGIWHLLLFERPILTADTP